MLLEELFEYKNELMKTLCSNKSIMQLMTDDENVKVPNHQIAYDKIFPFEYIPDTVDKGDTFICYDVDIIDVENKTYLYPAIYVWIFTHKSKLRLPQGGARLDSLAIEINKELNGSRYFGLGELCLKRCDRFVPIDDYQGRCLVYYAKDFNNLSPSKKPPANRRSR